MKKKTFLQNTLIVTVASLIFQITGMSFRVYMSSKVGAEALGLYQLILTIYAFVLSFATSGISLATTRLVTDFIAGNKSFKIKKTMLISFACAIILSVILGLLMFFSASPISINILKDERAATALKILSFSLPFAAVSSCCRGYFYALRKVIKTTSEQLIEQITEITVFAIIIGPMISKGIEYACYAIAIGTVTAEIISALYSFFLYKFDIRHLKSKIKICSKWRISKKLIKISLPVSANACLRSGLSMIENILIPRCLKQSGASYETALCEYGMLNGMVMPIINFPGAVLVSFSMLLIPEISEANVTHNEKIIKYVTSKVFGITLIFSVMVTGILFFFGKDISLMLYSNKEAGFYISLIAPIIPLTYLDSMVDAILKGLNDQVRYLTYNLIDSVIRIILILICLPIFGIKGLVMVIFASEILNSTLSILRLMKLTKLKLKLVKWIIKPYISIIIPGFIFSVINMDFFSNSIICGVFKIIASVTIYIILLFLSNSITKEDINFIYKFYKFNSSNQKQT